MRIKRLLLTLSASVGGTMLLSAAAFGQFTTPYLSGEKLSVATAAAKDSIGDDALLVGIATAGEIDLGAFGKFTGFNVDDGTSNAWGYQFLTPAADDGVALGVVQFLVGDYIEGERGNDFGLDAVALDLSGAYAGSDAFVEQLKKDDTFNDYMTDYPDAIAEGIVLTWQPDGQDFLPEEFPLDKPIWAIYFNTNAAVPDDSTMACYVASGTGETYCIRAEISGVEDDNAASGSARLTVSPNPAHESATAVLRVRSLKGQSVQEAALYDIVGRKVTDLTDRLVQDGVEGKKVEFGLGDLAPGSYVCRVVQGNDIQSIRLIVD